MEEHNSIGITSEFDWYEITIIKAQLSAISARLEAILSASKEREKTSHDYILHLRKQNDELRVRINKLVDELNGK